MNSQDTALAPQPAGPPPKPRGGYRVLHTADWHLGKMLGERSREDEHRRFLAFLLQVIREQGVDALLIAGDVFDSANPPQSAVAQYFDFLSALFRQGGCAVIIVAGNHDSPGHLEAPRQVLKALGAHVVGALPGSTADLLVPLPAQSPQVVVAAVPFLRDRDLRTGQPGQGASDIQRDLVQGITQRYKEAAEAARDLAKDGIPLLATGHLMVAGSSTCESEREIHVGGLGAVGGDCFSEMAFAYLALGHLHRPQNAAGRAGVRYAGSPLPLSFSEANDRKELCVLDFADGRLLPPSAIVIPRFRPLARVCARRAELEQALKEFQIPEGELPVWVEVVVEDPAPGENLYEVVRELVRERHFEVVRVTGKRTGPLAGLNAADPAALESIDALLGDPAKVFAHRLEAEPALPQEERAVLQTAFEELRNLYAEKQREGDVPAREKKA